MTKLLNSLYRDDAGFILSGELALIATLGVLALVVGLSEVAFNVNKELEDLGSAFGSINQSYQASGTHGHKGCKEGNAFYDSPDFCDGDNDIQCGSDPGGEW